jgi:selenide,water dikinase
VDARIDFEAVPILPEARQMAEMEVIPGGTQNNLAYVSPSVDFDPALSRIDQILLADAQTSGGLLISLPADEADALVASLVEKDVQAFRIGELTQAGEGRIAVRK